MAKKEQKTAVVKKDKNAMVVLKEETADLVLKKVQIFQRDGELDLPANYSAANALKSAWLYLQDVVDKNKKPALEVCTKASIANAMLNMVVQGLNPGKMQCYFIVYGNALALSRSYLGNKAICLRVNPTIKDIYAEVVYDGDQLEYSIILGQRVITEHRQKLENIDNAKIVASYAMAIDHDDKPMRTELMTMVDLKAAWAQSKMHPITDKGQIKAGSTHAKFTAEMAKKTVTNRLTKHIIGSSSDSNLVIQAVKATDDEAAQAEAQEEVEELSNAGEVIDIKPAEKKEPKKPAEKKAAPDPEQEKGNPPAMTDEEKEAILREEMAESESNRPGPDF